MAVVKGTPVITSQADSGPFTVTLPAFVAGDIWLAFFLSRGINTISSPAGWTQAATLQAGSSSTDPLVTVFTRVADGSEGATAAFTGNAPFGGPLLAAIYPMSGVDTDEIFASTFSQNNATVSGPVTNSPVTNSGTVTNYSDSFLFYIQASNQWQAAPGMSFGTPSGWTNDLTQSTPEAFDRNLLVNVHYKPQPTLGATGAINSTFTGTETSDYTWMSAVFALKDINGQPNQAPTVDVGPPLTVYQGMTASATAVGSDPEDQALTYQWTRLSGPSGGVIASPDSATTDFTDLLEGIYTFRCTATDEGSASGHADLTVTVQAVDYPTAYVYTDGVWQRHRMRVYSGGDWV